ncbi:hypothetical protein A1O1_05390 [Capronia coronata CBS 617.96]|uniref:Uncharacterized protein n=1 Tax=Capronia coronata CBS 617.96 TaxID=1182541 RepID=W9YFM4_9EURO|nr:uncharacterized protein A1O1_05390 [Capronia coronata CBS 617.96]EXJ88460.1 hypothetical protein A1O1_05390 [Capronia coronata CBS 617.96]
MGGGPDKEHVLITLFDPEPKDITGELRRRFPHFEVTYVQVSPSRKDAEKAGNEISDDLWKSATILITLFTLPAKPELVPK